MAARWSTRVCLVNRRSDQEPGHSVVEAPRGEGTLFKSIQTKVSVVAQYAAGVVDIIRYNMA